MLKKAILVLVLCAVCSMFTPAMAKPAGTHGTDGEVSGRSVGAAVRSEERRVGKECM